MLLTALTPPDTVPWVTESDLRDVSDAKEEALLQWDARLAAIFEEYQTHPQRLDHCRLQPAAWLREDRGVVCFVAHAGRWVIGLHAPQSLRDLLR